MLSLVVGLVLSQQPFANETPSERLRTVLPNGVTIVVERMPKAGRVGVCLTAAARGVEETPATHGLRHLLEHLIAPGKGGDVDRRLEPRGATLTAQTSRETMSFRVSASPADLERAVACLQEMVRPDALTAERIAKENKILEEEIALAEDDRLLGMAAWDCGYGPEGLDPLGGLAVMAAATPEGLTELHAKHFASRNLTLSIVGNVDLDATTRLASRYFGGFANNPAPEWRTRTSFKPGRREVDAAFGDARAAAVPGVANPRTMWTLSAGLAVAALYGDAFATYTPSAESGLVIVGQTTDRAGVNLAFDEADPGRLFPLGRRLAKAWLNRQLGDPSSRAALLGTLSALGGVRYETLEENLRTMTPTDFAKGLAAFARDSAVVVVGGR